MKTFATISSLHDDRVGPALFSELESIAANAATKRSAGLMDICLPVADVRYQKILDKLGTAGFRPRTRIGYSDFDATFPLFLRREYDDSDCAAAPYLELSPSVFVYDVGMSDDERTSSSVGGGMATPLRPIPLLSRNLAEDIDFAHTRYRYDHGGWIVVPDRVRRLIESAGLVGAVFKPTVLVDSVMPVGNVVPWERFGEPWWEFQSSPVLPPVSPKMELYDGRSNPITRGNTEVGAVRIESYYRPVELHYLANEMAQMPPFDLARTREAFFARRAKGYPEDSALVASKRFYQFCVDNNLKTNWIPVRIDAD